MVWGRGRGGWAFLFVFFFLDMRGGGGGGGGGGKGGEKRRGKCMWRRGWNSWLLTGNMFMVLKFRNNGIMRQISSALFAWLPIGASLKRWIRERKKKQKQNKKSRPWFSTNYCLRKVARDKNKSRLKHIAVRNLSLNYQERFFENLDVMPPTR